MYRIYYIFCSLFLTSFVYSQHSLLGHERQNNALISGIKNSFDNERFFQNDSLEKKIIISPHLQSSLFNDQFLFQTGFSLANYKQVNKHWEFKQHTSFFYSSFKEQAYQPVLQNRSFFFFHPFYADVHLRMDYQKKKFFSFNSGIDKHHIGEGNRSMFISNSSVSSPFIQLKTNLWKFEYSSTHQVLMTLNNKTYVPKANTFHYLNFNHKNKISFGIFENIVQGIYDTLYNRGYEVEYLNPLIFYRPQEYSVGSSDNVVLGLNGAIYLKKTTLYGQVVIDDINIAEIRAKSKWWANKYGLQFGVKYVELNKAIPFFIRSECNIISPYTFSALDEKTSYENALLPLAHPSGANFIEFFNEIELNYKNLFRLNAWLQYITKGEDLNGFSYGGDIYQSYINRPHGDYGYFLLNGEKVEQLNLGINISKQIKELPIHIFIEPKVINRKTQHNSATYGFISFGINSGMFLQQRNY